LSIQTIYPFDNPLNYIFNPSLIDISGSQCKLVLQDNPSQSFVEDFENDTGFVYDNTKAEFVGGLLRQKDTRPANATFYASYTNNINGNWGEGVLTGTAFGGAGVSGGKLDLKGGTAKYVDYSPIANADSQQTGTIRLRLIPNYSGAPSTTQVFTTILISTGSTTVNLIDIIHLTNTLISARVYDQTGTKIVEITNTWLPNLGQTYEIEFNYDITGGASRLFIDGNQIGATDVGTGIRSSSIGLFRIGNNSTAVVTANFEIDDIIIYSTVQHTSNYTPDWSNIFETIYLGSKVELPQFSYPGPGSIQEFTNLTMVETNAPGQIWNGLYWNGSMWTTSNGTFGQSNNSSVILANISSFPSSDTLDIDVLFNDNNDQKSVDNLNVGYTGQIYPITNPTVEFVSGFSHEALEGFFQSPASIVGGEAKYILKKDNNWYYHNSVSGNWEVSDQTYAQSNTADEINTNKATFTTTGVFTKIRMFVHSNDGTATPILNSVTVNYNFYAPNLDIIDKCIVHFTNLNDKGLVPGDSFEVYLENDHIKYKTSTMINRSIDVIVSDPNNGYAEVTLVETENMEGDQKYIFKFKNLIERKSIPNEVSKNYYELV
jgi:hypothetical protein